MREAPPLQSTRRRGSLTPCGTGRRRRAHRRGEGLPLHGADSQEERDLQPGQAFRASAGSRAPAIEVWDLTHTFDTASRGAYLRARAPEEDQPLQRCALGFGVAARASASGSERHCWRPLSQRAGWHRRRAVRAHCRCNPDWYFATSAATFCHNSFFVATHLTSQATRITPSCRDESSRPSPQHCTLASRS